MCPVPFILFCEICNQNVQNQRVLILKNECPYKKKEQSLLLIIETAKLSNLEGFKILFICGVSYEIQPILEHFFFEILSCYLGTSMETYAKSLPKHLPKSLNELGRPNSAHKRIILQPLLNWHKTNTLRLVTMGDGLCCY